MKMKGNIKQRRMVYVREMQIDAIKKEWGGEIEETI